nr:MAG TPA: hypothetical protein [Caudoviricetes sp.]
MGVLLFNRIRTMLLTASLLFLSEVIRLLYAEKEIAMLGQTGSTSLPNKIVRLQYIYMILQKAQILQFLIIKWCLFLTRKLQVLIFLTQDLE